MKNRILKLITGLAAIFGMAILFTQCEANESELIQMDGLSTIVNAEGTVTTRGTYDETKLCECLMDNYAFEELSDAEKSALVFMREEEKLAKDVYQALYEKWDARIFNNIATAEQRHMDAVGCLLIKYGLDDPTVGNENGVFENATLQELYNTLTDKGILSMSEALIVGATIEDLDIFDLLQQIPNMDNADIIAVFEELNKGSRNHLRAFIRNLNNLNESYAPQYISEDIFTDIINSPKEKGGSICGTYLGGGNGSGNGTGTCAGTGPHDNNGGDGTGVCPHGNTGQGPGNGPHGKGKGGG